MNTKRWSKSPCAWASLCVTLAIGAWGKDLAIERPSVQQMEDGPIVETGYEFLSGETFYVSFRVSGFTLKEKEDEHQFMSLRYTCEAFDGADVPLVAKHAAASSVEVLAEDKNWEPKFRWSFVIPEHAPGGRYRVVLWVKDENSGAETRRMLNFNVRNREVEPSAELVLRNFGFFRTEDSPRPLETVVYRAGDPVWVRFDIAGYKLGEKNRLEVSYGVTVSGEDGKAVINQPQAAVEKFESFYPRRWLPAGLRLDLPKDAKSGPFTLVVEVRDGLGGQKLELRREFTVE